MQSQTPSHGIGPRCALGLSVLPEGVSPTEAEADSVLLALEAQGATVLHVPAVPLPGLLQSLQAVRSRAQSPFEVVAIDAELGAIVQGKPQSASAQLCSLDKEEAITAVRIAVDAMKAAAGLSTRFVRLRLGEIAGLDRLWHKVRAHFLRGALAEDEEPNQELLRARSALLPRHLDAVRRSLEQLSNHAVRSGQTLLLGYPRRATELPHPIELRLLLEEFDGAPLAPCLDLPSAHLASTMRLISLPDSVRAFAQGPLHMIGDACGPIGALPPGSGEVDVAAVCRALPKEATLTFLPWPGLAFREVKTGLGELLRLHPATQHDAESWPSSPIPVQAK